MTHRSVSATVLALVFVLGGTSPAFALTRQAAFEWAPAGGPVAGYAVYASVNGSAEALVAYVSAPGVTLNVESNVFVSVRAAAYDSAGQLGPRSDASTQVRLCPGDFDGDEIVGPQDLEDARSCFGNTGVGFCAGADLNLNGTVSASDIASLNLGSDACPASFCAGDFDHDGRIGMNDINSARQCFGQPAQGACAAGDMDGNGVVSTSDANYLISVWGREACSL